MLEYQFNFNEDYCIAMISKYRSQSRSRWWFLPLKVVCAIGLLLLTALCIFAKIYFIAFVLGSFIGLLVVGPRFDYWIMKRKVRKSPFYLLDVSVVLSDDGWRSHTSKSKTELAWDAFTKVRRLKDGYLLFQEPNLAYWLPDIALVQGTTQIASSLFSAHITDHDTI